jgi:hypothetical protein
MKLRINLEIDVSHMTMLEMAAMVDRIRAAIDTGGRKRVVQMRLPSAIERESRKAQNAAAGRLPVSLQHSFRP